MQIFSPDTIYLQQVLERNIKSYEQLKSQIENDRIKRSKSRSKVETLKQERSQQQNSNHSYNYFTSSSNKSQDLTPQQTKDRQFSQLYNPAKSLTPGQGGCQFKKQPQEKDDDDDSFTQKVYEEALRLSRRDRQNNNRHNDNKENNINQAHYQSEQFISPQPLKMHSIYNSLKNDQSQRHLSIYRTPALSEKNPDTVSNKNTDSVRTNYRSKPPLVEQKSDSISSFKSPNPAKKMNTSYQQIYNQKKRRQLSLLG